MKKRLMSWRRAAVLCVAMGSAAVACAQVQQFKWGHIYEPASIFHQQAELAARKIAEQSEGKIKIEVVPASKLGQERDYALMLANDSMQIAYVGQATLAEGYPPLAWAATPSPSRTWTTCASTSRARCSRI
ncbi:hypothetical protein [Variovorax boronicumulans]